MNNWLVSCMSIEITVALILWKVPVLSLESQSNRSVSRKATKEERRKEQRKEGRKEGRIMGVSPSVFQCLRFLDCTSMEEVAKRQLGRVLKNGEFLSKNAQEAIALFDVIIEDRNPVQSYLTDLFLKAENLCETEQLSKCNPFVVVSLKSEKENIWREVGRTKITFGSLSPQWMTPVCISYRFEQLQKLRFSIFSANSNVRDTTGSNALGLEEQFFLGATECCLCEILVSAEKSKTLQVDFKSQSGTLELSPPSGNDQRGSSLTVSAEKVSMSNAQVEMILACRGLADRKKIIESNSQPFLVISRVSDHDEYVGVYKTEVVTNNSMNPTWLPINIPLQQLCNGDVDQPLLIECFDFEPDESEADAPLYNLIGQVLVPFRRLQDVSGTGEGFELERNQKHHNHGSGKPPKIIGKLFCLSLMLENDPCFLDYIFGGCEIGFMVAIDFTNSNGPPESPMSLHYIDPNLKPNPYQSVISSVGRILDFYSVNKVYRAYGFGALVGIGTISHCFNLNGQATCAEVSGVNGILDAYQTALLNVKLAGPTLLAQTIREATRVASQSDPVGPAFQQEQKYHILLVIVDGVINDMEATWNALEEASPFPLSVLIVGVGDADFSSMEALDSENRLPRRKGGQGRNILRFITIKKMADSEMLASELLSDLPGQLVEFMRMRGIMPNQSVTVQEASHFDNDG